MPSSGSLHSRYIRGANLAFYQNHRKRLIHAIGPDVVMYQAEPHTFQENAGSGTDPRGWTTTVVEGGAGTSEADASNAAGETFRIVTAAADNDGLSMQLNGESFELTSDQEFYFGCRLKANDATQTDFFVGLAITDTAILGGVTDRIGFECLDASTDVNFALEKDSTETLSGSALGTFADDTYMTLEFYWDGTGIEVFVDDASAETPVVTNLPDDEALRLSVEFLTGEAVANTLTVQWMRAIMIGR